MDEYEENLRAQLLFALMHRPIPWDPAVGFIKDGDQMNEFNEIQTRLNAKMAQLQVEKVTELCKVANIPLPKVSFNASGE